MAAARILLLYATRYGHTALVAERLAARLRSRGHAVDVRRLERPERGFSTEGYGAILLGGPVYGGRFPKALRAFVAACRAQLEHVPSAFFSVGLASAGSADDRAQARRYLGRFARESGWLPREFAFFAGALSYTRYRLPLRLWMRLTTRQLGARELDRDHVFTDWLAVQAFADLFADELERLFAQRPAGPSGMDGSGLERREPGRPLPG